jgi:hypothetical protein
LVRVGGLVLIDSYGVNPEYTRALDDVFVDSKNDYLQQKGGWFRKSNTVLKVPEKWNTKVQWDKRVITNFETLEQWFQETSRKFVGNVQDNRFQSQRYVDALKVLIAKTTTNRINICETGFNGGHSAMMFMALNSQQVQIHYYGWDLGQFGSAKPIAAKMTQAYPGQFQVFWGDSKKILRNLNLGVGVQCHFISIDGEHSYDGVQNDLQNLLPLAAPNAVVFSDDVVPDNKPMYKAWVEFVSSGEIVQVASYRNPQLGSPGFMEGYVTNVTKKNSLRQEASK